jgi:CHAT domain
MEIIIIRISEPVDGETGYPMCLEEYHPGSGQSTVVTGTECLLPDALRTRASEIFNELRGGGGNSSIRQRIGKELYRYLAETAAGQEWIKRWRECEYGSDVRLRAYLDIKPEFLQRLPWELMMDENEDAPFLSADHRPMRGDPNLVRGEAAASDVLPIRVLVIVCDIDQDDVRPQDRERLAPQAELDAIHAALRQQPGMWQVEVLRQPAPEAISEALQAIKPQILHIIGETYGSDDLALRLSRDQHEAEYFKIRDLERIIRNRLDYPDRPRIFVLNACRTAEMTSTERFRRLGTRAIVTNQAVVYGEPAIVFSQEFYHKLAETGQIDEAMRRTRGRLSAELRDYYDWGIPVLTVYGDPATVIRGDWEAIAAKARGLISSDDYDMVDLLVDRLDPSRKVWRRTDGLRRKHLALITGQKKSGKSQLLRSCMLTWKLRGHPAILIDPEKNMSELEGGRIHPGTRELLLHICDLLMIEFASSEVVVAALRTLKAEAEKANYKLAGNSDAIHPHQPLCGTLIKILKEATIDRPLMLAFDRVDEIWRKDLKGQIKDSLFDPITRGRAGDTYVVIAIADGDLNGEFNEEGILGWSPRTSPWSNLVDEVQLASFSPHDAGPLGHEYGARKGWVGLTRHGTQVMPQWLQRIQDSDMAKFPWLPSELYILAAQFELEWLR